MINQKHIEYLSKVDNTLKNIIKSNTVPKISKSNDYILDLYKYIIFQQISTKAGNSIFNRFLHYYKANKKNIASWSENEWKSIGLSMQKKNYIENIFELRNEIYEGNIEDVLIEKQSKRNESKWAGRTNSNKWVVFEKCGNNVNDIVPVLITESRGITLYGEIYKKVKAA